MAEVHDSSLRRKIMRYFRQRRMRDFARLFPLAPETRVLDIGGTRFNWSMINERPRITMVNVEGEVGRYDNIEMQRGDATRLEAADNSFDLVYSNSVVEHVGDWTAMEAFAANVRRLAPRYYVQTPNKWFPIEPHHIGLFLHWLPDRFARRLYNWLTLRGWLHRRDLTEVDRILGGIRLLSRSDLRRLFPDGTILEERLWLFPFVPKSLIVVRGMERKPFTKALAGAASEHAGAHQHG